MRQGDGRGLAAFDAPADAAYGEVRAQLDRRPKGRKLAALTHSYGARRLRLLGTQVVEPPADDGLEFLTVANSRARFDFDGDSDAERVSWLNPETGAGSAGPART